MTLQTSLENTLWIQESVITNEEIGLLTLITGFVNGNGEIFYTDVLENFQKNGQPPLETYTNEIPLDKLSNLKNKVSDLIHMLNIHNTYFLIQFVRRIDGEWYAYCKNPKTDSGKKSKSGRFSSSTKCAIRSECS